MTTLDSQGSISGHRRVARVAAAAGLVAALVAAGSAPVLAADAANDPATAPVKTATPAEKLGKDDAQLLADAESKGQKSVTVMVATQPGKTAQVAGELDAIDGAIVAQKDDKLGYVRATLPTAKAKAALGRAGALDSVQGMDLQREIKLDDPKPDAGAAQGASAKKKPVAGSYPAPGKDTPAKNPYNPSHETGAVEFVKDHPKADGRGVTIGILDSGVDLAHPALQKTTTGERKIVDWVTATDPVADGDGTWRRMTTEVSGPTFTAGGRTWSAPAGTYKFSVFSEAATLGGEMQGDLNRDGDTTDKWGVLYDAAAGTVRVDLNDDGNFGNDEAMKPYKDGFQVGYFGTDNPATEIAERIPFVVEVRKNVQYGDNLFADYVSIGVIEGEHGTHVAGITAANSLFGGKMNGAAPGAKIVSSRACTWSGGCTNIALFEGMKDLATNRGVDIINMSIGGLPALNYDDSDRGDDADNARALLYNRLIDQTGVQLVISAGNSGPGINTIGDPGLANKVLSVGAAISKETWAANYGSQVEKPYAMFNFSSRGPTENGNFTPTVTAPGSAINTIPTWQPGGPVAEAGYPLPAGYGMLNGTSMSSPQATGASALLISAAKQQKIKLNPLTLRTALASTAHQIPGVKAHEQGAGLIDINEAWESIKDGATANSYAVKAPVDTALDHLLQPNPGFGTGIYDREGGLKVGQRKVYDVVVTRTSGPDRALWHDLSLKNDDGTFDILGAGEVKLPLNQPVTIKVAAKPKTSGVHSAIVEVDDFRTEGVDKQILATVVASNALAKPSFSFTAKDKVQRNSFKSYFVTVPQGAKNLEVALGGLAKDSQTRFISFHPYGVGLEDTASTVCYNNYNNPANTCRPDLRSYANPQPGVWEIEVESRRTSPLLENPFELNVTLLGASFDPAVKTLPEARIGTPATVDWKVTNEAAALEGKLKGGSLGSAKVATQTIKHHESQTSTVVIGEGVERLDVAIGNTSDKGADLDLTVLRNGAVVGQSADGDSEEAVSLVKPAAGTYTIVVDGYSVPSGETTYDYKDVFFSAGLGTVQVDDSKVISLANGATAQVSANVLVNSAAPEGRQFFGEVSLVNARGTAAGKGSVVIEKVTP
ncbi:S8 family serine peptidase [Streptomyces sp. NPDC001941]|uniref:S8 family serine peptidase n=1 Tax=Streptomyces sp. NPDC001941 TaxID=3154659 RepID=UPI00332FA0EF